MISQLELDSRAALCRQLAKREPAHEALWLAEAESWSRFSKEKFRGDVGSTTDRGPAVIHSPLLLDHLSPSEVRAPMSDDPKDVIEFAIRSAFLNYPKEDDPNWRSPHWIEPKECAHFGNGRHTRIAGQGIPDREELTPILSAYSTALPFINLGDAVVQSKRIASFIDVSSSSNA
jgi:hypothetical protein